MRSASYLSISVLVALLTTGCRSARTGVEAPPAWNSPLATVLPPAGATRQYRCYPVATADDAGELFPATQRCLGPDWHPEDTLGQHASVWLDSARRVVAVSRVWSTTERDYPAVFREVLAEIETRLGAPTVCGNAAEPWHRAHFWRGSDWYLQVETHRIGSRPWLITADLRPLRAGAEASCRPPI